MCVKPLMLFTAPAPGTAFPAESVILPSCAASPICSATNPGPAGASRKLVSPRLTAGSETWLWPCIEMDWSPIKSAMHKSSLASECSQRRMNEPLQRKVVKWARRPQINPVKVPIRRRPAEGVRVYCAST
jgi:hypothetical protein